MNQVSPFVELPWADNPNWKRGGMTPGLPVTMAAIARGRIVRSWGNWPSSPKFYSVLPYLAALVAMR